jgi:hypothetical protein
MTHPTEADAGITSGVTISGPPGSVTVIPDHQNRVSVLSSLRGRLHAPLCCPPWPILELATAAAAAVLRAVTAEPEPALSRRPGSLINGFPLTGSCVPLCTY